MTEKRFKIVDEQFISYYGGTGHKISNGECGFWLWHNKIESQKVCDKLNSIFDENEQLKDKYNEQSVQYEGLEEQVERLLDFKDTVFKKIDMHLQRLPKLRDDEFESDDEFSDPSLYTGAIQMLETLKKELQE